MTSKRSLSPNWRGKGGGYSRTKEEYHLIQVPEEGALQEEYPDLEADVEEGVANLNWDDLDISDEEDEADLQPSRKMRVMKWWCSTMTMEPPWHLFIISPGQPKPNSRLTLETLKCGSTILESLILSFHMHRVCIVNTKGIECEEGFPHCDLTSHEDAIALVNTSNTIQHTRARWNAFATLARWWVASAIWPRLNLKGREEAITQSWTVLPPQPTLLTLALFRSSTGLRRIVWLSLRNFLLFNSWLLWPMWCSWTKYHFWLRCPERCVSWQFSTAIKSPSR